MLLFHLLYNEYHLEIYSWWWPGYGWSFFYHFTHITHVFDGSSQSGGKTAYNIHRHNIHIYTDIMQIRLENKIQVNHWCSKLSSASLWRLRLIASFLFGDPLVAWTLGIPNPSESQQTAKTWVQWGIPLVICLVSWKIANLQGKSPKPRAQPGQGRTDMRCEAASVEQEEQHTEQGAAETAGKSVDRCRLTPQQVTSSRNECRKNREKQHNTGVSVFGRNDIKRKLWLPSAGFDKIHRHLVQSSV